MRSLKSNTILQIFPLHWTPAQFFLNPLTAGTFDFTVVMQSLIMVLNLLQKCGEGT